LHGALTNKQINHASAETLTTGRNTLVK
jgi:hypothetical protein